MATLRLKGLPVAVVQECMAQLAVDDSKVLMISRTAGHRLSVNSLYIFYNLDDVRTSTDRSYRFYS